MAKCPHCDATIDRLSYSQPTIEFGTVILSHRGNNSGRAYLDWESEDSQNSDGVEFSCPECNFTICTTETEAIGILQGDEDEEDEEPEGKGIFFCERHQVRFDESCAQCIADDRVQEAADKLMGVKGAQWHIE